MTDFALFGTSIGVCGVAWTSSGIVAVQLPEASEAATQARMLRRYPQALESSPPVDVVRAIEAIAALTAGAQTDLGFVQLDMRGVGPFEKSVYDVVRLVMPGSTVTYGEVARRVGSPGAARAVGKALGGNPFAIVVPCHRVLGADGKVGGFSANGGVETKVRLLSIERARTADAPSLFGDLPLAVKPHRRRAAAGQV
jgi:methylated-DNA-[protein]-cysteine S-methyltransferase